MGEQVKRMALSRVAPVVRLARKRKEPLSGFCLRPKKLLQWIVIVLRFTPSNYVWASASAEHAARARACQMTSASAQARPLSTARALPCKGGAQPLKRVRERGGSCEEDVIFTKVDAAHGGLASSEQIPS